MTERIRASKSGCGAFLWLTVALLSGCRSVSYRASNLPTELVALPAISGQSIELTGLVKAPAFGPLIRPGDVLQVRVASGDDEETPLTRDLRVARDGTVILQLVGPVRVAGTSLSAAGNAIRQASIHREIFRNPAVDVTFKERRKHQVTVMGAVNKPGPHQLYADGSTLTAALLAAGGLSEEAGTVINIQNPLTYGQGVQVSAQSFRETVPVSHNEPADSGVLRVSLLEAANNPSDNYYLQDGALVTVNRQPERYVTVIGITANQTMRMPYDREFRVLEALARAGGPRYSPWVVDKVEVIRKVPQSDQTVAINLSLRKAKRDAVENLALAPGDIVSVEETPLTFTLSTIGQLLGIGQTALVGATAVP